MNQRARNRRYYVTEHHGGTDYLMYWATGQELLDRAIAEKFKGQCRLRARPSLQSIINYLAVGIVRIKVQGECGYHHTINCCAAGSHVIFG